MDISFILDQTTRSRVPLGIGHTTLFKRQSLEITTSPLKGIVIVISSDPP